MHVDDVHSMSLHMAQSVTGSFQLCRASNGILDIAGIISLFPLVKFCSLFALVIG